MISSGTTQENHSQNAVAGVVTMAMETFENMKQGRENVQHSIIPARSVMSTTILKKYAEEEIIHNSIRPATQTSMPTTVTAPPSRKTRLVP